MRGTLWRVPIIRTIIYWGLYSGLVRKLPLFPKPEMRPFWGDPCLFSDMKLDVRTGEVTTICPDQVLNRLRLKYKMTKKASKVQRGNYQVASDQQGAQERRTWKLLGCC